MSGSGLARCSLVGYHGGQKSYQPRPLVGVWRQPVGRQRRRTVTLRYRCCATTMVSGSIPPSLRKEAMPVESASWMIGIPSE